VISESIEHARASNLIRAAMPVQSVTTETRGASGYQDRPSPRQGANAAPTGDVVINPKLVKQCRHGDKILVTGYSQKTGRNWAGYDCPQNESAGDCNRFAQNA